MSDRRARLHLSTRIERGLPFRLQRRWLVRAVRSALQSGQVEREISLTVVITSDTRIRELNRTYRDVDAPTDVLSFSSIAGEVAVPGIDDSYLGDVIISFERAAEQAATLGHSVEEEIALLVVHGVLHLLGYDHEEPGDKRRMWSLQDAALDALGIIWRP